MEQSASTYNIKTKQLFLKKKIVVKFISGNGLKKGFVDTGNTDTTTSITIPTTIIITNPG